MQYVTVVCSSTNPLLSSSPRQKKKIQVDSVNKPGILLEVVQILTDLDFIITKAYISSDGGWFMDGMLLLN